MKYTEQNPTYLIKVFLAIFLPMAGVMAILLAFFNQQVLDEGMVRLVEQTNGVQRVQLKETQIRINHMVGDFYYLSKQHELFKQLAAHQTISEDLTAGISRFISTREWIDQFRFLDTQGNELYRVDQPHPDNPILIPAEQLQNKSHRDYFIAAVQLDLQKFNISPVNLNQEHGKVEVPFKPMLRMAMSIFDKEHRVGVVVVNFRATQLLEGFLHQVTGNEAEVMLLNRDGGYLLHTDPGKAWGADLPERSQYSFGKEHAQAWDEIDHNQQGMIKNDSGVYIYQGFDLSTISLNLFPIQPSGRDLPRWKTVVFAPAQAMAEAHGEQMEEVVLPYSVLLFLLAVLSVLFALKQQKLKRSLAMIRSGKGHLEKRIKELNCLYDISHLTESESLEWHEMMQGVVNRLPTAWEFSRLCSAKLLLDGQTWKSTGDHEPLIFHKVEIINDASCLGLLSIGYDQDCEEDVFGVDKSALLEAVALRIHKVYQIRKVKEELKGYQLSLETQVLKRTEELGEANQSLLLEIKKKEELALNLDDLRQKAEAAMKIKSNFLSLVVHDLKSPFFSLLGVLRRIVKHEQNLNPKHRELLINSINSGEGLLKMVDKLIGINKIHTGKIVPEYQVVDVSALVQQILCQFQYLAEQKGVLLTHSITAGTEFHTDPFLFGEVINNLVSNGIKFCAAGDQVTVEEVPEYKGTLAVRDTGLGIEPERVPQLFKEQINISTLGTLGEKGSGLGLTYCADVMRLLEGKIWVKTQVNQGSQFCFQLPAERLYKRS